MVEVKVLLDVDAPREGGEDLEVLPRHVVLGRVRLLHLQLRLESVSDEQLQPENNMLYVRNKYTA